MRNLVKIKVISVLLAIVLLVGTMPINVFASNQIEPLITTAKVGDNHAIFIDFSVLNMEISNIEVETEAEYVLPVITAGAVVLVFPEDITPTIEHRFIITASSGNDNQNFTLEINGLGEIIDSSQIPSRTENGELSVWGGEVFWNNEQEIWNFPANSLVIRKENRVTGELLSGARFSLTRVSSGNDSGLHGTVIGEFDTNSSGIIVIAGLEPGFYIVEELIPPANFTLDTNTRQRVFMRPDDTSVVSATFSNLPFGAMVITLRCSATSEPIPNGEFRVTTSNGTVVGTDNGAFWTNLQGEILIPNLTPDSYVITQVSVPQTHVINLTQSTQTLRLEPSGEIFRADFFSDPLSQLLVTLRCEVTSEPLQGGEFRITNSAGNVVGSTNGIFFTNQQGEISIPNLGVGSYIITQINPPEGYRLGEQNSQTVNISRPSETYTLNFTNIPYSGLIIQSLDGYNNDPLPSVRFRIDRINETGNVLIGEHVTDNNGRIELIGLLGSFNITQLDVPSGWEFDREPSRIVHVNTGTPTLVTFHSPRMGSLEITLQDEGGNPLSGGRFEVRRQNGELIGEFTTNQSGGISLPNIGSGWVTVEQIAPPQGFVMTDATRSVEVRTNTVARAAFTNRRQPSLVIEKVDTEGNPLSGAEFEVRSLGGELVERAVTNNGGLITIAELAPGSYQVIETRPPDGFVITEPARAIEIMAGQTRTERFVNHRLSTFVIQKVDGDTGEPLQGVIFEITTLGGERIRNPQNNSFEFITDNAGMIRLPELPAGSYVATETRALPGYILAEPVVFSVGYGEEYVVTVRNYKLPTYIIRKIDGDTGEPLQGVVFEIARYFDNGQSGERIRNPLDGSVEFVTDSAGLITLPTLPHATYIAIETRPLEGYTKAEPRIFVVGDNEDTTIIIRNYRLAILTIRKINSVTRSPIEGVVFQISHPSGQRIQNPDTGFYDFVTDNRGIIHLPTLPDGTYWLTETRPADGYFGLSEPMLFEINSETRGRDYLLEVENTPASGLLIVKTDEATGEPLEGVVFEVRRADGRLVSGQILDGNQPNTEANSPNRNASGGFITDQNGRILLNALPAGEYHVIERQALDGYELDSTVHNVTITPGRQEVLNITNRQKAGLRLLKIDSITRQPIFGVEFMVFDMNNRVVGTFITDDNGVIDFAGILSEGRYTIRETRPADGYYRDDIPRTVEFVSGRITEIVWENTPQMGQIQILKLSGDDNEINGLPKGTPLAGAVFEVYHHRTGNLVDRFVSGSDGRAVSKPLPLGRYTVREVETPQWYKLSDEVFDIEIEFATQIIRREFLNYSANTGVTIRKTGNIEAMSGDVIRYDIRQVRNDSTVPLTDFYWRDVIPTEAVRLERIVTGTYNQALRYKIIATTNKGDNRVIADNLSTTVNNVIDTRPAALGLSGDEFITSFTLVFGTVRAGFTGVEQPQVFVRVLNNLPNGMEFANRVDVGGKYGEEWVVGSSGWVTSVYAVPSRLPRTGW